MVLPILVLPATQWREAAPAEPPTHYRPFQLGERARRRSCPRWQRTVPPPYRAALLDHWRPLAVLCAPRALEPLQPTSRSSVGCRNLLAQCESLLRHLQRRRRDRLGLSHHDLARVALALDGRTLRVPAVPRATIAFFLASMYWEGYRHPLSLFASPMHPPTGLVSWLSGFTVQEQVEYGRRLLTQLAKEEDRMLGFALRLTAQIDGMTMNRNRGLVLLPELLKLAEKPKHIQRDSFITLGHKESRTYELTETALRPPSA